jgi:hypothetical protein
MKMKRAWLAIPAMVMCMGFTPIASAQEEITRFDDFFKMADTNKDGMMSKQEFMNAAGLRYDAMMAKMKKMGDKGKTMMKGDLMTKEGAKMFIDEWKVYSGS